MRVTARRLVEAARAGKSRRVGNSSVEVNPDKSIVFRLHGHAIADIGPDREVSITLAGWPTVTTRSRINDILRGLGISAGVCQSKGAQYLWVSGDAPTGMDPYRWYTIGPVAKWVLE